MTLADELERLGKLATEGPWHVMGGGFGKRPGAPTVYHAGDELNFVCKCADFATEAPTRNSENAALIVALRNNLPAIIAALREQEQRKP